MNQDYFSEDPTADCFQIIAADRTAGPAWSPELSHYLNIIDKATALSDSMYRIFNHLGKAQPLFLVLQPIFSPLICN